MTKKIKKSLWHRLTGKHPKLNCFISYSHRDGQIYATKLSRVLSSQGIQTFRDSEDLKVGERWIDTIQNRLQNADAIIFIGSPEAFQSEWVNHETRFFLERRQGLVIPIVFRGHESGLPLMLRDIQWLVEDPSTLETGPSDLTISHLLRALGQVEDKLPKREVPSRVKPPKKDEKLPLNEGKLILVGRGEVGKTSLVKRLIFDEFRGDEAKTQGINISNWTLTCGESENIRLNVWDFGGQEIMHATHQFFLTERSLYLLVLNGREGGEDLDAEYWLKHVESFGGESPVIIVQNKIGQHPFELNYRGLRSRYPQIVTFIKTDCSDRTGIANLREAVRHAVEGMSEIRMKFPTNWFAVKEELESMNEDFMGFDQFSELCRRAGVDDESDRDTLCWVLHCLGIALNYRDDPRLRETSVLKPEWATDGIYRILNAKQLAERHGEIYLDDLAGILPTSRYPKNKHYFLVELMRKFSLCFPYPDDSNRFLIPDLLGKEEPEESLLFQPDRSLNFEYQYGIMPEGLLPRFIVRSHTLSRDQARWRSGVVLAREGSRALINARPSEKRITIRIVGGDAGARRRLLAIIRYDFEKINSEFRDRLQAEPKVPLFDDPDYAIDYRKLVAFEKEGVQSFPEYVGDRVVNVNVKELLDGIDLEGEEEILTVGLVKPRSVFFSYSHKDESLRDELETHLKLLLRLGVITGWHDRKIMPGSEWEKEIDRHLENASVILLLLSADFIASNYCWDKEVRRALERHESEEAIVIPVFLRECDIDGAPFEKLQGLPDDLIPITAWDDRDAAWTNVAKGIRKSIKKTDEQAD